MELLAFISLTVIVAAMFCVGVFCVVADVISTMFGGAE